MIAKTPKPPYFAVIFTSTRTKNNDAYAKTAQRMVDLAKTMPGFLGVDSAREDVGITVSYWKSLDAINSWRQHPEHVAAQKRGREEWYETFSTRVCMVEKESSFG